MADMPYTQNPYLPKVRAQAVELVKTYGWGVRQTARYIGVSPSAVSKWLAKSPAFRIRELPTQSSRPHISPLRINRDIEQRIIAIRGSRGRCSEIVHAQLRNEGISVSLSTVKRVLKRHGLIKSRSPWKKYHVSGERPKPEKPGILVQTDTIHIMQTKKERMYIFTLIDCFSRWAFAQASERLGAAIALDFVNQAQAKAPFVFSCIQSDHGPEFTAYFTTFIQAQGIRHRHSRVRKPNDNAHVERFNRTIQDELREEIRQFKSNPKRLNMEIQEYLNYYNNERLHLGINCKTPAQMFPRS